MEEVDLRGVEASGTGRDGEVDRRKGTDSGFSGDFVGLDLPLEVVDGGVGENEGNLLLHEGNEGVELRDLAAELLFKVLELLFLNALGPHADDLLDEGLNRRGSTFLEMTR